MIRSDVLNSHDARLGPPELPPQTAPHELLADAVDAPVEVVRGEKGEVAAGVAVVLDHVVRMPRDVLLVSGKDDEVVAPRELLTATDRI